MQSRVILSGYKLENNSQGLINMEVMGFWLSILMAPAFSVGEHGFASMEVVASCIASCNAAMPLPLESGTDHEHWKRMERSSIQGLLHVLPKF